MEEVESHNFDILVDSPLLLVDVRVQMIVPALTTLLADAAREALGYLGPVARPILVHKLN